MFRSSLFAILVVLPVVALVPVRSANAQVNNARLKGAIDKGVAALKEQLSGKAYDDGRLIIAAYALLKTGAKPTDPEVAKVLKVVLAKTAGGKYKPVKDYIYSAGCELMLLEAAETTPGQYRKEMKVIVDFIVQTQHANGYWNYLNGDRVGDTSVSQYAVLGLWAAKRAGVDVPYATLDRIARWLMTTQRKDGSFMYRPASTEGGLEMQSVSMTVAGTATLAVCRMYLFPNYRTANAGEAIEDPTGSDVIEDVNIDRDRAKKKGMPQKTEKVNYKPSFTLKQINASFNAGYKWVGDHYAVKNSQWPIYMLYGSERLAALADGTNKFGRIDWFLVGSGYLLSKQLSGGGWQGTSGTRPSTAFALLFLTRSTFKLLGKKVEYLGEGLLRGSRGLPKDLSSITEGQDGKIKKRKITGPIDQLLAELKKPRKLNVEEVQEAIVKKIKLGDRKQWLEPKRRKQLLEMAEHPQPEVRQVAIWALGRTGNIDVVSVIMKALEKDPDLGVAVEARNALCWLSRRPRGFGLAETPEDSIPVGATKEERAQKVREWRAAAVSRWKKWYFTVRPYQERDDLTEHKGQLVR